MSSDLSHRENATPGGAAAIAVVRRRAGRELAWTCLAALIAFAAAAHVDAMETLYAWSQRHDQWQLDETFSLFVVGAVAMAIFSTRRWRELTREMASHRTTVGALKASEHRLQRLFDSSPFPIVVISLGDEVLRDCNHAFELLTGYRPAEALGHTLSSLRLWAHAELASTMRQKLRAGGVLRNEAIEYRTKDGIVHPALLSAELIELDGQPAILAAFNDMTERRQLEEQLTHQAFHDALTGLPNRALFQLRLQHALRRAPRSGARPTVLFLDLDNFKRVNDTQGHAAGDELLTAVARRLQTCLRTEDTCARLGGDEFAILLEDTAANDQTIRLSERLLPTLQAPYELSAGVARIGVSIGVAISDVAESAEVVLRNADIAMYLSKARGKGRFTIFETSMHAEVVDRLALESDLHLALERHEFRLDYQPIVSIATGEIIAIEALLRWQHPVRGVLAPAHFLAMAESTGLIVDIGRSVLHEACKTARQMQQRHPDATPVRVSVNLSGVQIAHRDLVTHVSEALQTSGLDAVCLILEITESVLVHNEPETIERLWALKGLGVSLAIDDFGTGYSSLAYLQRFPVDILKIDKSFTEHLGMGAEKSAIARAVLALGSTISLQTIVEGIETVDQWERLRELGCELGQGFFLARPGTIEALDTLIDIAPADRQAAFAHPFGKA